MKRSFSCPSSNQICKGIDRVRGYNCSQMKFKFQIQIQIPNQILFLLLLLGKSYSNELTKCCSDGERQFLDLLTCSRIANKLSGLFCTRTASICCLRASLNQNCEQGRIVALNRNHCSYIQLGGALKKECCECCLLAKDMSHHNVRCIPPDGLSFECLRSFEACCNHSAKIRHTSRMNNIGVDDLCTTKKCEHICKKFSDEEKCFCRDGYELAPDKHSCIDIDECALGAHDCGPTFSCRNTQGSYRCDLKSCPDGRFLNPLTGICHALQCPYGYRPSERTCKDIDECAEGNPCKQYEECVNTVGSYKCNLSDMSCGHGYRADTSTGTCLDIDECADGTHNCDDKQCINVRGSYKCLCSLGYEFNETLKACADVDECQKFAGHVCSINAICENAIGSFNCLCKSGYKLAEDGRNCQDIDECDEGLENCAQKCLNVPGSYQCFCDRGYQLGADGINCDDIDECNLWSTSGDDLCMGSCVNTPGSYKCLCPAGYELQDDERTCKDIDECQKGFCKGENKLCVNTLSSFKCHGIKCPPNYVQDKNNKNNVEDGYSCLKKCQRYDALCLSNQTNEILYQFRAVPSMQALPILIEISRIKTTMDSSFSVRYVLARGSRSVFFIEQIQNVGIIKAMTPLKGPKVYVIRVHIDAYSGSGVLLNNNIAFIRVYVSPYHF